jgi:hypothetical protein
METSVEMSGKWGGDEWKMGYFFAGMATNCEDVFHLKTAEAGK